MIIRESVTHSKLSKIVGALHDIFLKVLAPPHFSLLHNIDHLKKKLKSLVIKTGLTRLQNTTIVLS